MGSENGIQSEPLERNAIDSLKASIFLEGNVEEDLCVRKSLTSRLCVASLCSSTQQILKIFLRERGAAAGTEIDFALGRAVATGHTFIPATASSGGGGEQGVEAA